MATGASTSASAFGSGPMDVQSLVNVYGGGIGAMGPRSPRHGTAERGRFRVRSRERGNSQPATVFRAQTQDLRTHPSGPQETVDWLQALEAFENRMASCERYARMHAQTLAAMEEQNQAHRKATRETNTDIANYKSYVEGMFQKINAVYEQQKIKLAEHDNAIQIGINDMLNLLSEKVARLEDKVRTLDASYQSLTNFVHQTARNEAEKQTFNIGTSPIAGPAVPDPLSQSDPWGAARTEPVSMSASQPGVPTSDFRSSDVNAQAQARAERARVQFGDQGQAQGPTRDPNFVSL